MTMHPPIAPGPGAANPFGRQTYVIRRKVLKLFGGEFRVLDEAGNLLLFSKQKSFKLKEDIRVYADETMTHELLQIRARQALDFYATYDVIDPASGVKVGALRRKGLKSIVKDEWLFLDGYDREVGFVKEDNAALAVLRRVLAGFAFNPIPQTYHGDINGAPVCTFRQNFNPFVYRVTLDFSPDATGLLDRRVGLAAAILLCAVERKQN